jgi:hypothetical protein
MVNTTVNAQSIDKIQISFECPYCWSKYKQNGEPTKRAKKIKHVHGSNENLNNRTEHRLAHCIRERYDGCFYIIIDDKTIRKN